MMRVRSLVLFLLFLAGGARRSIRIDDSQHGAQQQHNMLAKGLEVSTETREALVPRGSGIGVFLRAGPQAGASREVSNQAGRRAGHFESQRAAPCFRFGPSRAMVALQAASGPEAEELPSKEAALTDDEAALIRLCATTVRGQRATTEQMREIRAVIARLEKGAPNADGVDLNGEWELLGAFGEAAYRSSPFFWAFRQAVKDFTTPVEIFNPKVPPGGPLASAIYAITDAIPFYDIGTVKQRISGIRSVTGSGAPEVGTPTRSELVSEVQLVIGRNFGLPAAESMMTTVCAVEGIPREVGDGSAAFDVELRIETTTANQSSLAAIVPQAEFLLGPFPSGDALDAVSPLSSRVNLRTTYLSAASRLRISRPILNLDDAQAGDSVMIDDSAPVFVYSRMA